MFILRIGGHQKRQNILKLHFFYATIMDHYIHVTDDSMNKAVQQFETLFA